MLTIPGVVLAIRGVMLAIRGVVPAIRGVVLAIRGVVLGLRVGGAGVGGDGTDRGLVGGRGTTTQPEKKLYVAGRPRQRACHRTRHAQAEGRRGGGHGEHCVGPHASIANHAARPDQGPLHLKLWFHHRHQVSIGGGAVCQRREHRT
jgi:hypothetical protein